MLVVDALSTVVVLIVNCPLIDPGGTTTVPGTLASEASSLESTTDTPPFGAASVNVTVPVNAVPPTTLDWLSVKAASAIGGGLNAICVDTVFPS